MSNIKDKKRLSNPLYTPFYPVQFVLFILLSTSSACHDDATSSTAASEQISAINAQPVDRSQLPAQERQNSPSVANTPRTEDECCSDPGSISKCWWVDAERDGVVCENDDDCFEDNECNKDIEINGNTPPNGWGICGCTTDRDCVGEVVSGVQLYGICTDGVCGPSYCNGYSICSCSGGCTNGPSAGYANPEAMCDDTDEGFPGGCCEGAYPTDPSGLTAGYCSSACDTSNDECVVDEDCTGEIPDPHSADCTGYVCISGTCRLSFETAGTFCEANALQESLFDGTASRNNDGLVPVITDALSCYETTCDAFGQCVATPVTDNLSCADDGSQCTEDYCAAGKCNHTPVNVDGPCNLDGDGCTIERCSADGICEQEGLKDCTVFDDDSGNPIDDTNINHCRADICIDPDGADPTELDARLHLNSGVCNAIELHDVSATENGFVDTSDCKNMTCVLGTEHVEDIECINPYDDQCNNYVCEEGEGCHVEHLTYTLNGTSCDDGNPCTVDDACVEGMDGDISIGICSGSPMVCPDSECTTGSCEAGACVDTPANETEACTDDDPCSTASVCNDAGECVASAFMDCSHLNGECILGICDAGSCTTENRLNGTACDDDNRCTYSDTCTSGVCHGVDVDCSGHDDQCNQFSCDLATGQCTVYDNALKENTICELDNIECTVDQCRDPDGVNIGSSELVCERVSAHCCSSDADCQSDTSLSCVSNDGDFSDCIPPTCQNGLCGCEIAASGTSCIDNETIYPAQCYESTCNGTGTCESEMLAIADVPNNLCSDLFIPGNPSSINTAGSGYLGSISENDSIGTILTANGSTLCAQNNYAADKDLGCEEAGTQEDLGYKGNDVAYMFRYETQPENEIHRHAYLVTLEADFDGAVYIQDDIDSATQCPEGNTPSNDTGCEEVYSPTASTGSITYERWEVAGRNISDIPIGTTPDSTGTMTRLAFDSDAETNYGMRIRGYLHPDTSGDHLFWITSDRRAELWLSTTESPDDKVRIAYNNYLTPPQDWDYKPRRKTYTLKSSPISLLAGNHYYIEVLYKKDHKQNWGDHMAVGWSEPGGDTDAPDAILSGSHLSPYDTTAVPPGEPSVNPLSAWQSISESTTLNMGSAPDGEDRLLLVAVELEYTSGEDSCSIEDVSFGGVSGTLASDGTTSGRLDTHDTLLSEVWLFDESDIANPTTGGGTVSVDISSSCTYTGITLHAGMYSDVNQTDPVAELKLDSDTPNTSQLIEVDDTEMPFQFYGTYWDSCCSNGWYGCQGCTKQSWGIGTDGNTHCNDDGTDCNDRYTPNPAASAGDYFTFSFRGTEVEYWGVTDDHHGTASIYIDDEPTPRTTTVNGWSASRSSAPVKLWPDSPLRLTEDDHTIKVVVNGDGTVVGDLMKYYSRHSDNPLTGIASQIDVDTGGNAVVSFVSCDFDENSAWHEDLDEQTDEKDTIGKTSGSVADVIATESGTVTAEGTWTIGPFVSNQITLELNRSPQEEEPAPCGEQIPWGCTIPYVDDGDSPAVMEEACANGNAALSQTCCDPCDTSCFGYPWCERGFNWDNSECDYCAGECNDTWTEPFDPIACSSQLPMSGYSGYTYRSMTLLKPDYSADGSWRNAVIYVDGSNSSNGRFFLSVKKIPWSKNTCDRANDDAQVTDITHIPSGGYAISGTLEGLVNSDHASGTGGICGGYDCDSGWTGMACHESGTGISANPFWPAKAYYSIYRTPSDGAMTYCITTRRPDDSPLDAVLTIEKHISDDKDLCFENYDFVDCERNNYNTNNAKLELNAQVNTQYKIGVSRYEWLRSPCSNDRLDGCDYILEVNQGPCP